MTTILGIDPGATGAIAMVCPMVEVWDMPATPHDLAALLRTFNPLDSRVYVEKQWARPTDGKTFAFAAGESYGALLGILATLAFPVHLVAPATWKIALGLKGADKAASRKKALERFPSASLSRVKDHGRAEALLIAEWGRLRG